MLGVFATAFFGATEAASETNEDLTTFGTCSLGEPAILSHFSSKSIPNLPALAIASFGPYTGARC